MVKRLAQTYFDQKKVNTVVRLSLNKQNKTKKSHLLQFYELYGKPAVCPRLSGKEGLHRTNDIYQNSVFILFSLSALHIFSSFSHVLCFAFPIFVFILLPPPHFCPKAFSIFSVVLLFPVFSGSPCSELYICS